MKMVKFDYGMEDKDPVGHVWFYEKHTPNKAYRITKDQVIPFTKLVSYEINMYWYIQKSILSS